MEQRGDVQHLPLGQFLERSGRKPSKVYFPLTGVVSIVAEYSAGEIVEMATVGREGFIGLVPFLGGTVSASSSLVQVEGRAFSMPVDAFQTLLGTCPHFKHVLSTYAQAFMNQVMVSVACNSRHTVTQRLARWLLMMTDRSDESDLPLTQEFLAEMLAVRRATVTEALKLLRETGAVDSRRGVIRINDRSALIGLSCECYSMAQSTYDTLIPKGAHGTA